MVIVKLMGGLGNQMFQYAAGRSLALKHKTQLKLDLSLYQHPWLKKLLGDPVRSFALDIFNIHTQPIDPFETPFLSWLPDTRFTPWLYKFNQIVRPNSPLMLREIPFEHAKSLQNFHQVSPPLYLVGHWQSQDYFENFSQVIEQDFTLKHNLSKQNSKLSNKICAVNSVSIHIRRADYVYHSRINQFHGALSADYYQTCIAYIAQRVAHLHFYIFGDDLSWAKDNLQIKHPVTFVEHNYGTPNYFEDMRLMSLCAHNIIANSTFSWWGAWLNKNPDKIVLAPKPWFKAKVNEQGIVPKGWIQIETQLL